nr:hypothetical protein [Tanacetum cinerariifolium]
MLVPPVVEGEGSRQPSGPQPPSSTTLPEQVLAAISQPQKTHTPRRTKRGEDDRVVRAATIAASLKAKQESSRPRHHVTTLGDTDAQTRFDIASKQSHDLPLSEVNTSGSEEDSMEHQDDLTNFVPPITYDSPLSGGHTPGSDEDRPKINELMNTCTKLSNKVLALKQFKISQDLVIKRLKKKVKRLEKKQRARTLGMKLFKIGTSKKKTLDKENASKQGRDESNRTDELNLSNKGSDETEVFDYTTAAKKDGNAAKPVSTGGDVVNAASVILDVSAVGPSTSVAGPSTSTTEDIFEDEMTTMAYTLMAIRKTRPRTTLVVIHDVKEEPRRATPPPTAQIQRDAMIAQRLFEEEQAQFEREQSTAREKAAYKEAKDAPLIEQIEDVHARIDADALLAERLQQEERKQFTVDEQARMLVDLIAERKRMVTYLKHMGKYTHNQLKSKSFEEIQMLYEKEHKWINDFVPMDFEEVNDSKQQAENSKKRSRADHDKESVKKQKLEEDDAKKKNLELVWI